MRSPLLAGQRVEGGERLSVAPSLPALAHARIPRWARAVLEVLRFDDAGASLLRDLEPLEYEDLLHFCDKAQLALTLRYLGRDSLPGWVQLRLDRNLENYSARFERLKANLREIAEVLDANHTDFVVVKGVSHSPEYTPDPVLRTQGDIDLWCDPGSLALAREALAGLGYVPIGASEGRHLPPMLRPSEWEWRGDYHASDLPIAVELHHSLWDEEMERIPLPCARDFWDRRTTKIVQGEILPVLSKPDTLAFAALHLLMHTLHGDTRVQRAWEIAHFLHQHTDDPEFWSQWRSLHSGELRRLETIVFALVQCWFGCDLPEQLAAEIEALPEDVRFWLENYSNSPLEALFHPSKDEIWLQLSLVESLGDKLAVLRRRILPLKPPRAGDESSSRQTASILVRLKRRVAFAGFRFAHHARAFVPTLYGGVKWYCLRAGLTRAFFRFQSAAAMYSLGMFVFFILYNLYLLGSGYGEAFLGRVAACLSAGSLLGTAPGALLLRRAGLRATLNLAILGSAAAAALRTWNGGPVWLCSTALANGVFLSIWAVCYAPAVADLTRERSRRLGFSIATVIGIGAGVAGGLLAGFLPGLLGNALHAASPVQQNRWALMTAAGVVTSAVIATSGLRFAPLQAVGVRIWPRSRTLFLFLAALACWTLATGALNPFFNAFFARRLAMSVSRIGVVFALSSIFQVAAVLASPALFGRLGERRGIAMTQAAAGAALPLLAFAPAGAGPLIYVMYMGAQYMNEPAVLNILMSRVTPEERGGASALYFVMTSVCGSLSAYAGGAAISRAGYPPVLVASGLIAIFSAFLFFALVRDKA
jgi:hypothetical protein